MVLALCGLWISKITSQCNENYYLGVPHSTSTHQWDLYNQIDVIRSCIPASRWYEQRTMHRLQEEVRFLMLPSNS